MVTLVDDMIAGGYATPVLVLANDPDAGGLAKADARDIPTAVVNHRDFADRAGFEAAIQTKLSQAGAELVCLAGFMRILTGDFTRQWDDRMLNIHPSLLPKYKGLNTHARAIDAGDDLHGCSVHLVTADLDDGPVLGQARVPVLPNDTPQTLATRVLAMEHQLYPAVLQRFARGNRDMVEIDSSLPINEFFAYEAKDT